MIVIKDNETGKILAEGLTAGGTGNTKKIMIDPKKRFGKFTDGSAMFETSIDIEEPKLITIEVDAPHISKTKMIKSSTQMWLIPGKDIVGEGIIIEVPGFFIDSRIYKCNP